MRSIGFIIFSLCLFSCSGGLNGLLNNANNGETYSCVTPSHTVEGCCAGHSGPQSCPGSTGQYYFSSSGKLQCADGTLSSSCGW